MKAKITIEPGCEAGSLYCGGCFLKTNCPHIPLWVGRKEALEKVKYDERCQPCLDSEVKDESN